MNLLGIGNNPEFWSETVRKKECYKSFVEERLDDWNKLCEGKIIRDCRYSEFKLFFTTGDRTIYQKTYYERRGMLATSAVLALIFPEEQKYLDFLQDIVFAICDEYTWCIPAHQPKLEENNKWYIDLFAAETSFALAETYTLLGDRLDPLIRERIKYEINERIVNSFLSDTYFWWEKCTNNWAAVCGGSVGCTLMLMRPDVFTEVKSRLDTTMETFLSGFKNDGYCLEGTGYWHYGFGYFITYADMLKTFTDGKEDYFKRDKVRTISTFIQKMYLSGISCVSFADSGCNLKYHLGTLHYLKKTYPDDIKVFSPEFSYVRDACYRFALLIRSATWLDEESYKNFSTNDVNAEYYADESEWYVKRTESYGFAAKAGNNNEHHNHNDVGTFIFAKNGKHIITDMGNGVYSRQYFRADTRYEMIECSSLGHNVPHFSDNVKQGFGSQFVSSDVSYEPGRFSMDIAGAYTDSSVKSVKRTFLASDDCVKLTDVFDYTGEGEIFERLVSFIEPEIFDGKIKIDCAEIAFNAEKCKVSVTKTVTSRNTPIYLIDLELNDGVKEFEIIFK